MVWIQIQIRTYVLLVMIWVQTVCNDYQQGETVGSSKQREMVISIGILQAFMFEFQKFKILEFLSF